MESDSGETRILLDCGTGVLAHLTQLMPDIHLDAVVLSHLHYDHMSDMLPMHYYFQFHPLARPLNVLLPGAPAEVRTLIEDKQFDLWPDARNDDRRNASALLPRASSGADVCDQR